MSRFSVSAMMTDSMQSDLLHTFDNMAKSPFKNFSFDSQSQVFSKLVKSPAKNENLDTPVFRIPLQVGGREKRFLDMGF